VSTVREQIELLRQIRASAQLNTPIWNFVNEQMERLDAVGEQTSAEPDVPVDLRYFISFSSYNGFGNCIVETSFPVSTQEHIDELTAGIAAKNPGLTDIVILDFKKLADI
jgi:hypothetical protein